MIQPLKAIKGRALCLAFLILAENGHATVHYLDQGTRYHLGDDRLMSTRDKAVVAVYPKIGTIWERDFEASRDDQVEVLLEKLWGVDAASRREIRVSIDGSQIGEINAGEAGPWRSVLKSPVRGGRLHTLRIETLGLPDPDDFVLEEVQVRSFTDARIHPVGEARVFSSPGTQAPAVVRMIKTPYPVATPSPGMLEAQVRKLPPAGREAPCGVYGPWDEWRRRDGRLLVSVGQDRVAESGTLASIPKAHFWEFYFKIKGLAHGDKDKHRLELQAGKQGQGWSFELESGGSRQGSRGGTIRANHLKGPETEGLELNSGWNKAIVHYCIEGYIWLKMNDHVFTQALAGSADKEDVQVKILGIELELSKKLPQS